MRRNSVSIVGAAETTDLGKIPGLSQIQLHADAALNAIADAGLKLSDIDGIATAGESPTNLSHYLGLVPTWVDGTSVGGCSFMLHVRHAAAAINEGLCNTVLITHGESGRSNVGRSAFRGGGRSTIPGQFEGPYGGMGPTTSFTLPFLRYMKDTGTTAEQLAMVAVVQRAWATKNPRATLQTPTTVEEVMNDRMIAYPFTKSECCLVTDGGGALILTRAERAKDFPNKPVYILGTGESVETPMISQMEDFTTSRAFRVSGQKAFEESGITHKDVDHLMIYDAFAHLPFYGLEDLGFCKKGEAGCVYLGTEYCARRQLTA
jgi:acetyl-CoA acetyltransferase